KKVAHKEHMTLESAEKLLLAECQVLSQFKNRRGIISMICGDRFDGKVALFLPLYGRTFRPRYFERTSVQERMSVMYQLLAGLSTISKKGIHGDIKENNILLRMNAQKQLEAVIADFGHFVPVGSTKGMNCIKRFVPPEFLTDATISPAIDVWAL